MAGIFDIARWKRRPSVTSRFFGSASSGKGSESDPVVSIVVCSIDKAKFRKLTDCYRLAFRDTALEIIGIHDATSLAEGYNRGISMARGELLILGHDDINIVTPDFAQRIAHHLAQFDLIGIAGTRRLVSGAWSHAGHPYDFCLVTSPAGDAGSYTLYVRGAGNLVIPGIQALDGVFMAMRIEVARDIRFDAATFDNFHLYDIDFSYRAFLRGYKLAVCRDLFIIHESQGHFGETWELHKSRFEAKFAAQLDPTFVAGRSPLLRMEIEPEVFGDIDQMQKISTPEYLAAIIRKLDE